MCDKLVEIQDEQKELLERLRQVQKQKKKKTTKQKFRKIQPFGDQYFSNKKKNFNVQSKIDYDYNSVKQSQKQQIYEKYKQELELENCTFQPELNEVSMHLVDEYRVPIYDRKPVDYSQMQSSQNIQDVSQDEQESQESDTKKNKEPKKIDKNFYKKQMEWSKQKQNKIHQIKVQRTLDALEKNGKPKLNTKKNKKLVSDRANFLDRIQHNLDQKERRQKELDKKYNSYNFKPRTNKNITATSKVQEQLQYMFDD